MMQKSLLEVQVLHEFESNFDGKNLQLVARGTDGYDYAIKDLKERPLLPICEWVGYHLSRVCGIPTPDFAVLHRQDLSIAFGSRIEQNAWQIKDSGAFTINNYFSPHIGMLGSIYTLDAFLPNPDRHGRNFMLRPVLNGNVLVSFDFSEAWLMTGNPMGNPSRLHNSNTHKWWYHFKKMNVMVDESIINKIMALPDNWLVDLVTQAPDIWYNQMDLDALAIAWKAERQPRLIHAIKWLSSPLPPT